MPVVLGKEIAVPTTSLPRLLGLRGIAAGLAVALLVVPLIGLPTAVVPNRFFVRMTPTRPQDYLFLALTALLVGLIAATYAAPQGPLLPGDGGGSAAAGSSPSSRSAARSATSSSCSPSGSAGCCAGSRRSSRYSGGSTSPPRRCGLVAAPGTARGLCALRPLMP